jgi:hypothetical protein
LGKIENHILVVNIGCYFLKNKNYATAPNRTVYAAGAVAPSGYEKPQSGYGLCAFFSATFLRLLETYGFLYRSRKNVIYSRNVMRHTLAIFGKKIYKNT